MSKNNYVDSYAYIETEVIDYQKEITFRDYITFFIIKLDSNRNKEFIYFKYSNPKKAEWEELRFDYKDKNKMIEKILVLSEQNNIPISFVTDVINEILKITNTCDEVAINFVKQSYFYKSIINSCKSKFNDYDLKQKRTLGKENLINNSELIELLSQEKDTELLQSLVTNPTTPTFILDNIIKSNEQNNKIIEALVTNSYNLTEELLNKILENNNFKQNKEILLNIAQNSTTTDFIFKKLLSLEMKYDYDLLKRYIAQNNNANNDLLTFIVETNLQNKYIKFDVAKNSNTSDELLSKLIFNNLDDYHLIFKALQNKNLSEQTAIKFINQLENLNKNKSDYLFVIAENKNSSTKLLDILLNNIYSDLLVRKVIASHKNTSVATLKKLSYDKSEIVREQVVNNDNATIDILHKLSYDNDSYIKNIAKEKKKQKKVQLKFHENKYFAI